MYSSSGCRHYIEVKYVIDATFSSTNCTSYAVDAEFCLEFVNIYVNPKFVLFFLFVLLMSESYRWVVVGGWAVLL